MQDKPGNPILTDSDQNKSESMKLIVVSDIFGKTSALIELVNQFSGIYNEISFIDPYDGKTTTFKNEEEAYQHFQQNCGLETLTERLRTNIENSTVPVDIIGFSVGASAVWTISDMRTSNNIRNLVCFYGSRIREKTAISPSFPTVLIFPAFEKSFDLKPVIHALERKKNVKILQTDYLHGFMNKESVNFSEAAYSYFTRWLLVIATNQRPDRAKFWK